jgi:hypothetical protein
MSTFVHDGRLTGALFDECGEWIWDQLQDDGFFLAGEVVDLILQTERELRIHDQDHAAIARALADNFRERGIGGNPAPLDAGVIELVLQWEDEFLGYAGIPRSES